MSTAFNTAFIGGIIVAAAAMIGTIIYAPAATIGKPDACGRAGGKWHSVYPPITLYLSPGRILR